MERTPVIGRRSGVCRFITVALACASSLLAQRISAPADPDRVIEVHGVRDLLDGMGAREPNSVEKALDADALRSHQLDEVLHAIRHFVVPPLTDDDAVNALGRDQIVTLLRPEQADWVAAFLGGLAATDLEVLQMEKLQLLTCDDDSFAALRGDAASGPTGVVTFSLDGPDATTRLAAFRASARGRHSSYNGQLPIQRGSIYGGSHVKVVLRWETEQVEGGGSVDVPVCEELFDGFRYRIQRVPLPGGGQGYHLEAEHHDVRRPVETMEVELPPGARDVHVPEVTIAKIDAAARAPGSAAAIVFAKRGVDTWHVVVVEPMKSRKLR